MSIKVKGTTRGFVTENGIIVPGSYFEKDNTVKEVFFRRLAQWVGYTNATQFINVSNLISASGTQAGIGAAQDGKHGIVHGTGAEGTGVDYLLQTTLNQGGTGLSGITYIEYYGLYDGAATLTSYLSLGHTYDNDNTQFSDVFSVVSINVTTGAGQKFHYYWRLTFS